MAPLPRRPTTHRESCACQACLAKLLSTPSSTNKASSRHCYRSYPCVLEEMSRIGPINNQAYLHTWIAFAALMCVVTTLVFS